MTIVIKRCKIININVVNVVIFIALLWRLFSSLFLLYLLIIFCCITEPAGAAATQLDLLCQDHHLVQLRPKINIDT